jgi:hypothetical protein
MEELKEGRDPAAHPGIFEVSASEHVTTVAISELCPLINLGHTR